MAGEDGVKELQRKRHSATPDVSYKGRVRKAAKLNEASDGESDEESESNLFKPSLSDLVLYKLITLFKM